ncbi:hypothetical protein BU17DRAFT_90258 [Hysterangium stoloniferum]|nr:hypothetical protein BU17DRAFT_90258 [Hysterangium stoloniferum]
MSNRPQLPHDTQRSSSSQSANQSSTKKLLHTTTRRTSLEDEQRQDREVLEDSNIAMILRGVKSGADKFSLPLAIALLSQIAETANPPLLPALDNRRNVRKCIEENDELFNLLGECLQKESFSEIRSLEMLQPDHSEPPHTPKQEGKVVAKDDSPRRLTYNETKATMAPAIKNYENYIEYLAVGKLDGYLDSIRREDKVTDLKVMLPLDPILLLHDLGNHPDMVRVEQLFTRSTVHLFGVSGSGKTRLALEGLCLNWGLYISCRSTRGPASGSKDFEVATEEILPTLSTWHTEEADEHKKNAKAADRVFAMLLCARIFILKQFVQHVPVNTDATLARRRWVLGQVLPPWSDNRGKDLFVSVLETLRPADTEVMRDIISSTLRELKTKRKDLFPDGSNTPLFVVIDEAQVAADRLKEYFRSNAGTDMRPVLREMYRFFLETRFFTGFILAGTGLSMKMVEDAVGSVDAKNVPGGGSRVFTDIGGFTENDSSQVDYIRRYITLSENYSDRRLLERMVYWFSGRHRLTASLIELFIGLKSVPRHRVLTSLVEHLTGFRVTDAIELEDDEPPISPELSVLIDEYRPLSGSKRVFENNREELIPCLVEILMRWTLASEPTTVAVENHMHDIIGYGVGSLKKITGRWKFKATTNYPVYICEPLVILALSSLFEDHSHTMRKTWMANALRSASNPSVLGYLFEQAILLVLMETFGGEFKPLSHAFHCSESLGSRNVTLVTLKRMADDVMQCYPVSWKTGASDRLGLKAKSPEEVLAFLHNPDGKPFLFPDNHMGPDVMCTLQDKETKELIILAVQAKVSPTLNAQKWRDAINSVTPRFFYTVQKGGTRDRYAPVSYPNLIDDLTGSLEMVLGPAVYTPIANSYRRKLRSSIRAQQQSASHSVRQTPRFLRIIATPDDEQQKRLKGEWNGDVAVLRWDVVERYIGSMADILKARMPHSSQSNPHKRIKTVR